MEHTAVEWLYLQSANKKLDLFDLLEAKAMEKKQNERMYGEEDMIHFAEWLSENEWVKRTMTHPNKVGQYYSHKHCEYKTIEQLFETYKKESAAK
jgi:hypothetical protein